MALVHRWLKWGSLVFALLIIYNVVTMRPGTKELWGIMIDRLQMGYFGVGNWDGEANEFDFSQLEPGDIVLGGNTGSSWGHWTHAALYLGDGEVMETFLRPGVSPEPVTRYNEYYSHAGALRVKAPKEVKEKAVQMARELQGRSFYLLSPRENDSYLYCTKVVWYVYKQQGIDLDPEGGFWVVPDRIFESPHVEPIAPKRR